MSRPLPPHLGVLVALGRAKVRYLLFGVTAINHYASDASFVFSTRDCDILLEPKAPNLKRALAVVSAYGYELTAGGEPLPWPDPIVAVRLVQHRALVTALRAESLPLDLMLDPPGGVPFSDYWRRRTEFNVKGVGIMVASLDDLLAAKEKAGRDKDRAFLTLYRATLGGAKAEKRKSLRRRRSR